MIASILLGLVGTLLVMYFKMLRFKYFIYITWFTMTLICLLSFIASIISYTPTIIIYELCDSLDKALSS